MSLIGESELEGNTLDVRMKHTCGFPNGHDQRLKVGSL